MILASKLVMRVLIKIGTTEDPIELVLGLE